MRPFVFVQTEKAFQKQPNIFLSKKKAALKNKDVAQPAALTPREGAKQGLESGILSAKAGTTLDALVEATGWLLHTTRAALTGLRKRGFVVERSRDDGVGASVASTTASAWRKPGTLVRAHWR